MKTSELQGVALDWAVAKCEFVGAPPLRIVSGLIYTVEGDNWNPSTDWAQGGLIIEREKIGVWWATPCVDDDGVEYGNHWYAEMGCTDDNADQPYKGGATGPTPLITAMRIYVYSKLGDDIELPEELK